MQTTNMQAQKTQIRSQIKAAFAQTSKDVLGEKSRNLLAKLELEYEFEKASTIMLFASLPDEVYTHDFIQKWADSKTILLPSIRNGEIVPCVYRDNTAFLIGEYNILEATEVFEEEIDLVIVPGQAFDKQGNRLGRGKGFYDRFLTRTNAFRIGICFDFQLLPQIPTEAHDIKMDFVISA